MTKKDEIEGLLWAYNEMLNGMLDDIWSTARWKRVVIKGKHQFRLMPIIRKDNEFKGSLRNKYLEGRAYAAHWVNSALKTAFSLRVGGRITVTSSPP